ncbi:MAG: purine-binding chemotaxis protein CheW [Nitrospinae bacterium]|nr:purine-binding chemotaxis protein CheW [Nitrospinota bacterium]
MNRDNSLDSDLGDFDTWDDEDSQKNRYLTFRVGAEGYGLEIRHVTEIIGIQQITEVPDMPNFVMGMINLRGTVIPIIDVRLRFGLEPREYDGRTCIIVTILNETIVGLIVDEVSEVADIPEDSVEPPPRVSRGANSRFIQGLGKMGNEVKIILDVRKLLYDEDPDKAGQGEQENG